MQRFGTPISSLFVSVVMTAVALFGTATAAENKPTPEQIRFFETKIRPLLVKHCYDCHGPDEQESGLRLDTYAGMMQGGKAGAMIIAGKPQQSLLITAINYQASDLQMPPEEKLSKREIADLTQWIKIGAPHPEADGSAPLKVNRVDIEKGRQFWSFRSPVDSSVPAVKNTTWPHGDLDRFVLAKLESKGIAPVAPADKRTLIRRVTFDLTGLPPTPADVDAFLADNSPKAFAKVVDRLLASKAYGERWGRHWLDVARYADSNGLDENVAHGNAWRYRDYVIAAFNDDLPYNQFLVEQLAGDLLPPIADTAEQNRRHIATAFLAMGPKVLAEVDETKMEMDIIDEQIQSVGSAVMGMTLGCVRCHAHKFDPFEQDDYYALAGIFKSTRVMEHFKKVARWQEIPLQSKEYSQAKAAHQKTVDDMKRQIEQLVAKTQAELKSRPQPTAVQTKPKQPNEASFPKPIQQQLKKLRDELAKIEKEAPQQPSTMGATEGKVVDLQVHIRGSHLTLGESAPRHFPRVFFRNDPKPLDNKQSGRLELARWLTSPDHPLTARVMVNRIWRWHFGRGIVASTDNFGQLGQRPVNQPLLDWLALRFVESGWSIKAMHRTILLSSTYRMSNTYNAKAAAVDPENFLQWRADMRRLEAEAIRDSLLAVSGQLDRTMGGSLLHVKNRAYFFNHTSKDETRYDVPRRSVYLPVVRNHLYDGFQLFDYNDASVVNGDRSTSTIAPQALFMLNGPLVTESADALAADLLKRKNLNDTDRLSELYERAYTRPPHDQETSRAMQFIDRFDEALKEKQTDIAKRRQQVWSALCQIVLSANEYIYIK